MRRRHLEMMLSGMEDLEDPDPRLEQYPTPSRITSDILYRALANGDVQERSVAELGCGGAPFAIGSWALGAGTVIGYDIDPKCIELAKGNIENARRKMKGEVPNGKIDIEMIDVADPNSVVTVVDTVFMNPPFGSQTRRADRPFIKKAMEMGGTIYSLHNGNTRSFLLKEIERMGGRVLEEESFKMELNHRYHFHTRERVFIDVLLLVYRGCAYSE